MFNSETDFFGKQEGERIFYVVRPHFLSLVVKPVKVYLIATVVFATFVTLGLEFSLEAAFIIFGLVNY